MGMQLGGSGGGANSDINVTPLVDVCLVLLIIFMVMIPRNVPEISVRIPPESKSRKPPANPDENLVVGLSKDGAITLNDKPMERQDLKERLETLLPHRDKPVVFVNFDDDAPYGTAVDLLDVSKKAGAQVLGIMKRRDRQTPDSLAGL